jgi:hypothetical protein
MAVVAASELESQEVGVVLVQATVFATTACSIPDQKAFRAAAEAAADKRAVSLRISP